MSISINNFASGTAITAHAFNKDGTRVALCPNTNEVVIYRKEGNDWKLEVTLKEHDSLVTGIDWAPGTNKIVTCSQDRNAYVWTEDKDGWHPALVILRLTRGCTSVKWSPKEDKFAVGSAALAISVCYWDPEGNWWVSRLIKNLTSTALTVSWHPNNFLLAVGGTDSQVTVYSAFVKNIDNSKVASAGTAFGKFSPKEAVGMVMATFKSSGWITGISFSPSGNQCAWVSRSSTIEFLHCETPDLKTQVIKLRGLPLSSLFWANETTVLAGGHDCTPVLFQGSPLNYNYVRDLDAGESATLNKANSSAKAVFEKKTNLGLDSNEDNDTSLPTKHQNRIIEIIRHSPTSFSTVGCDGNQIIWPFSAVNLKV